MTRPRQQPAIRVRRRWHPGEDHIRQGLPWRWTCDNPGCPHLRLEANAPSREVAQRQADAHLYVAAGLAHHATHQEQP